MKTAYLHTPFCTIAVDAQAAQGPLETWRQTVGHGGINPIPLPPAVIRGIQKLQPRLIRIFLSEFFDIYPDHDTFHWDTLDPYMVALAQTGAKIVASINIKPSVLFPTIDHAIWQPNDVAEWQRVLYQLVRRYSVEKPVVTYWEVGNETDIGEMGGAPFLVSDPRDYITWYTTMLQPILEAFPEAKVGGPACCWVENEPLPGLVQYCRATGTRLDFISWHCYNNDVARHLDGIAKGTALLDGWPGPRPEMLYTEWSTDFELDHSLFNAATGRMGHHVSVDEMAYAPRRAATVAAAAMAMSDTALDWSFYYHIWDQVYYPETFRRYFSQAGIAMMVEHWNELPHRFGLFGVNGEVRPQYFVFQMLARLGEEKLAAVASEPDVRVLAARAGSSLAVMLANYNATGTQERVAQIHFTHLTPGSRRLTVYRIDSERRWSEDDLELLPVECRDTYVTESFRLQVALPRDSVALLRLEPTPLPPAAEPLRRERQ